MVAAHAGRGRMRTMQTIITLTAVGIVAAIAALWWFILARLLPLYQSGALPARARSLFHLATALLCWVSALAVAYIGFGSNEAATMITVLAAIGLLSWGLLSTVRREGIEAKGATWPTEEEAAFKQPVLEQYEREGHPYYATARLWDDGIIDPADTRRVLGLGLSASMNAPAEETRFGIFRM